MSWWSKHKRIHLFGYLMAGWFGQSSSPCICIKRISPFWMPLKTVQVEVNFIFSTESRWQIAALIFYWRIRWMTKRNSRCAYWPNRNPPCSKSKYLRTTRNMLNELSGISRRMFRKVLRTVIRDVKGPQRLGQLMSPWREGCESSEKSSSAEVG